MASHSLPPTSQCLQFTSATEPAVIVDLPTPVPSAGSVILKVLYSNIVSYAKEIFCNGNPRAYNYPLPFVPGTNAICRVAASAPDTPRLKPGMLVYTSGVIRARDSTTALPVLHGMHMGIAPEGQAIMSGEWRNGTWGQFVKVPAENVHPLNEEKLTKTLGYEIRDLAYISTLAVSYGGLSDVAFRPGETVIVAPASGSFGSAAVFVALAMGASKVVAMGRNEVTDTAYMQAAVANLRPGGRMSIMGGIMRNVELPYSMIMFKSLTLKGTFMYTRKQADDLIRLIESGLLPIGTRGGVEVTGTFPLASWDDAFEHAFKSAGPRKVACFAPNGDEISGTLK